MTQPLFLACTRFLMAALTALAVVGCAHRESVPVAGLGAAAAGGSLKDGEPQAGDHGRYAGRIVRAESKPKPVAFSGGPAQAAPAPSIRKASTAPGSAAAVPAASPLVALPTPPPSSGPAGEATRAPVADPMPAPKPVTQVPPAPPELPRPVAAPAPAAAQTTPPSPMATPVPLPAAGTSSADASPLANLRRNAVAQPPAAPNAVPPQHASLPPPPVTVPAPANDPAAVAVVIEQAELQISIGNVKAARTALEAAAKAGSLAATVALAATYDPLELAKVLVPPGTDDVQTAVKLYSEAAARGSRTARARLDRLLGATADEPGQSRPQQK